MAARITVTVIAGGFVLCVAIALGVAIARHQDVSGAPAAIGMALFAGARGYRLAALSYRARGQAIPIDVLGVTRGITGRSAASAMDRLERRRQELSDWLAATTGTFA